MIWIEFHIRTTAEHADQLTHQLNLLGAQSITFRDAGNEDIYEPSLLATPIWSEVMIVALFESTDPIDEIGAYLESQRKEGSLKKFELQTIPDEDWTRKCLDSFKPMSFGQRLWICPTWTTPPNPNAFNVILDPGLAFGTGTHPTTALCLEWLDKHIQTGVEVIDYGCGSGILSIAALKLGAKKVIAIDHDPQALESTKRNAETNDFHPPILKLQTQAMPENTPADVLIANILAKPLIELAGLFSTLVKNQGKIVLSGVLSSQVEDVKAAYNPWFTMDPPSFRDEWTLLTGVKRG